MAAAVQKSRTGRLRGRARGRLALLAACAALVPAVSTCGDDGPADETVAGQSTASAGAADPAAADAIMATLERAFTTASPRDCTGLYTAAALEQTSPSGATAADAVAECEDYPDANTAKSVDVSEIAVDGTAASARVEPHGGPFAGVGLTVALVEDDGWKIDGLEDAEIVDRPAQLSAIADGYEALLGPRLTSADASCLTTVTKQIPDAEIEAALLSGEVGPAADAMRECLGAGTDIAAILKLTEAQLAATGVPKAGIDCVTSEIVLDLDGIELEELAGNTEVKGRYEDAVLAGLKSCGQ